jgi:hypothetical protein
MRRALYPYCKIDFSEVIGGLSAECDNDIYFGKNSLNIPFRSDGGFAGFDYIKM